MKVSSLALFITTLILMQTTQYNTASIKSIDNRSGMTYELSNTDNNYMCTKGMPETCYPIGNTIREIHSGSNDSLEKSIIPEKIFKLAPKMPLTFDDGRMMKVSEEFVPNATIFFTIQGDTLYYKMKSLNIKITNEGTGKINNSPKKTSHIYHKTYINTEDTINAKSIPITGTRLIINPDHSLSIE